MKSIPGPPVLVIAALIAGPVAACTGGASGPRTGILAPRVSEGQEVRAGQRAAREAARTLGLVADQELQDYVQQVGGRVAGASGRSQLSWTFRVVDDPMPNAFAMPGGYVFLTRGILAVINSEAELAGVIAHEVAHVVARHGGHALARQPATQLGLWAVPIPELRGLDGGAAVGSGFLFFEHGAEEERQADEMGFRYVLAAGYDVREVADVFSALGRLESMGGRSALPAWLATHPDPGERVATLTRRAAAADEPLDSLDTGRDEYLEQIEDLAYGQDPRQGFFRGATFVHPELRFRLELPAGWRYRSLAQALVATSPDRDAALQLTVVEQASPDEAAERFLRQPGIGATGDMLTDSVAGNPVVTAQFRATTSGGAATGLATWLAYGGRTYQIVGVASGQPANGHAEAFRQSLRSFAPETDARVLEVRPSRINIVRLGRPTTFEDFNRRYPSAVDAEEIALLNRVAGPGSRLRAGGRMKRVMKG